MSFDNQLLARLVDGFPHGILVTDAAANIVYVNRRFEELTGYAPEDLIGKNPRVLSSGQTSPETYARMWETISQGRVFTCELIERRRNEELYWARLTVFPLRDETGAITHYVGQQVDISADKKLDRNEPAQPQQYVERQLKVKKLRAGMILKDDVKTVSGVMLLRADHAIDSLLLRRLIRAHATRKLVEPIRVDVPEDTGPDHTGSGKEIAA